jgi:hypothetical protein
MQRIMPGMREYVHCSILVPQNKNKESFRNLVEGELIQNGFTISNSMFHENYLRILLFKVCESDNQKLNKILRQLGPKPLRLVK